MYTPARFFVGTAKKISLFVAAQLCATLCFGNSLKGRVVDAASGEALVGATVKVVAAADSTKVVGVATNAQGFFEIDNMPAPACLLSVSYLGYRPYSKRVVAPPDGLDAGKIAMQRDSREIESVEVTGTAVRATQRGDTTEFNADAYKVTQDATTEDLLKKLPGVTVEDGTVKTQGEEVKKILVDGKPFFGDDPTIAIRNLPAEIIDKIEVFERMSDQAALTGFDDGEGVKAMNIVTKPNRRMGQFGRVYGGAGYDDTQEAFRYSAGGNLNLFNTKRRISILAMTNNVNQQNFAQEDLSAAAGSTGGGRRGGMQFGGNSSGIAATHALGINYSDTWGTKTEVAGSYFFNYSDKNTYKKLTRNYLQNSDSTQQYNEQSDANSLNINHRFNLRLDHKFTQQTSLLFEPNITFSTGDGDGQTISAMLFNDNPLNSADNQNSNDRHNLNVGSNLMFSHKFEKKGRSFSARVYGRLSDANTENTQDNKSFFDILNANTVELLQQRSANPTNNWETRSNISYTEPLGAHSLLQAEYEFNYSFSESNKKTYDWLDATEAYTKMDSLMSNIYTNNYSTSRADLRYRFNNEKINATAGLRYQNARLDGNRIMPTGSKTQHRFTSLLPNARIEYKFSKHQALRIDYRTSTNAPSISQLQDVINNSNPLLLSAGNPDLVETNSQNFSVRYNQTSVESGTTFFAMFFGNMTNNYISNSTVTARQDTMLRNNGTDTVWLRRGAQFSQPVNINGYFNTRAVLNFGIPIAIVKSNLNIMTMASYSRQPGYINGELVNGRIVNGDLNIANDYSVNLGLALGSNISEFIDFNVGYNATYNTTVNSLQSGQDNSYFRHSANVRLTWIFWNGITLYSATNYDQYRGLSSAYNEQFLKWDAGFGKKFLNKQAELKLMVYDMFNTSKSYSRSVTESYIEDAFTNILSRYFMLTFTYTLRNFGTPPKNNADGEGRPPMGMRGGGGGGMRMGPPPMP